ncbi:MAG TPA: hypothetical protein DF383_13305, partial [Deltaproteobacteria bacterium]|nr:hypothetical protein [Deltaproteobacteria bacterium]
MIERTIPKESGDNPPLCEKHGTEKKALNLSFNSSPLWRWFCSRCTEEQENQDREAETRKQALQRQNKINRSLENAMIAPRFRTKTFENYQAESDKQAHVLKEAKAFLEQFGKTVGMIFMGRPGTGKNHLASAITSELVTTKNKTALITTAMKILRAIKESWSGKGSETQALQQFLEPDLLVIDELGVQFGSDTERLFLTEIINDRHAYLKPTLLLTNLNLP